jgi:ribosome-binding factor A
MVYEFSPPTDTPRPKKAGSKAPSPRQLRVGEEIRHLLAAAFLRQDFDAEILRKTPITVSEVSVAPDLRYAIAYISPLGGSDGVAAEIIGALKLEVGRFNHLVAKNLTSKFAPRLKFMADERFENAAKIHALLKK